MPRILKAMRVVSFKEPFATSDIERLTKAGKNHIGKLTQRLHRAGYLALTGARKPQSGKGQELLYRMIDPDRFRKELLP